MVNFLFHISIHNIALILLFFAQIFGQSMDLYCSCVSCLHDQSSWRSKSRIFTHAHTDLTLLFCCKSLRCATSDSIKISGVHQPYFPYWSMCNNEATLQFYCIIKNMTSIIGTYYSNQNSKI